MPLDWGPNTSLAAGRYWAGEVGAALGTETRYADKVLRVRYEDLLASPETITDRVASFAGLEKRAEGPDFETVRMPDYYTDNYHQLLKGGVDTSRSEAWRDRLSARDIELFEFASGELLDMLGYKSDFGVKARPPRLIERARLGFTDTMRETMHAFTWVRKLRRSG
jgi:hypothetical protein